MPDLLEHSRNDLSFFRDDDIEVLADETSDPAEDTSPVRAVSRTSR